MAVTGKGGGGTADKQPKKHKPPKSNEGRQQSWMQSQSTNWKGSLLDEEDASGGRDTGSHASECNNCNKQMPGNTTAT